jgi:hypothetical protein
VLLYQIDENGTQRALTAEFIDTSPYIDVLGS